MSSLAVHNPLFAGEGGPSFREVAKGWVLVLSVGNEEPHPCKGPKDAAPELRMHQ
jgi:hypothetical protein